MRVALKSLRIVAFLILFSGISRGFYILFGESRIISYEVADTIAGWISIPSMPEDVYDIYDYAEILLNAVISIIVFSVILQFIPLKKLKSKNLGVHTAEIGEGVLVRILKFVVSVGLFTGIGIYLDYDKLLPVDASYGIPLALAINTILTISSYWVLKCVWCWFQNKHGA